MFLGGDKTSVLLEKSLNVSALRYEVIANNLANIDTPGFKKSYVVFEEILQDALENKKSISIRRTHPGHFGISDRIEEIQPRVEKDTQTSLRLEGNNVDIEDEMIQLVMNSVNHNFAVQRLNSKLAAMRYVISDGRG
jgi:flagellar basal-body rod protein FlgB